LFPQPFSTTVRLSDTSLSPSLPLPLNPYQTSLPPCHPLNPPFSSASVLLVQALVSADPHEKAKLLQMLLHHMQCGDGLMHESVNAQTPQYCTRPDFEWANAMLVALYEKSVGDDCDAIAEQMRLEAAVAGLEDTPAYVVAGSVVHMPQMPHLQHFGGAGYNPVGMSNPVGNQPYASMQPQPNIMSTASQVYT
jgi:hypothetical protein